MIVWRMSHQCDIQAKTAYATPSLKMAQTASCCPLAGQNDWLWFDFTFEVSFTTSSLQAPMQLHRPQIQDTSSPKEHYDRVPVYRTKGVPLAGRSAPAASGTCP